MVSSLYFTSQTLSGTPSVSVLTVLRSTLYGLTRFGVGLGDGTGVFVGVGLFVAAGFFVGVFCGSLLLSGAFVFSIPGWSEAVDGAAVPAPGVSAVPALVFPALSTVTLHLSLNFLLLNLYVAVTFVLPSAIPLTVAEDFFPLFTVAMDFLLDFHFIFAFLLPFFTLSLTVSPTFTVTLLLLSFGFFAASIVPTDTHTEVIVSAIARNYAVTLTFFILQLLPFLILF